MSIVKATSHKTGSLDEMFVQAVRSAFAAKAPIKVMNAPPVLSIALTGPKLDCGHVDAYIYYCYTTSPYERGENLPVRCY